jgi:hypothetical protein
LECTPESRQKVKQQALRGVKWEKHVGNSEGNSKYPFLGRVEIHPSLLARWKKEFSENPDYAFRGYGNRRPKEQMDIAKLQQLVGQLYAENDFLKKALSTLEAKMAEERKHRQGR